MEYHVLRWTGSPLELVYGYRGDADSKLRDAALMWGSVRWQSGAGTLSRLSTFYDVVEDACDGRKAEFFLRSGRADWTTDPHERARPRRERAGEGQLSSRLGRSGGRIPPSGVTGIFDDVVERAQPGQRPAPLCHRTLPHIKAASRSLLSRRRDSRTRAPRVNQFHLRHDTPFEGF